MKRTIMIYIVIFMLLLSSCSSTKSDLTSTDQAIDINNCPSITQSAVLYQTVDKSDAQKTNSERRR